MATDLEPEVIRRHEEACLKRQNSYLDPQTGYSVMTRFYLINRGTCCSTGCRHCPYGFRLIEQPAVVQKKDKK